MPVKHQSESYRIKNGKKYKCINDISFIDKEQTILAGKKEIKQLRFQGKNVFGSYHKDGYYRIFELEIKL